MQPPMVVLWFFKQCLCKCWAGSGSHRQHAGGLVPYLAKVVVAGVAMVMAVVVAAAAAAVVTGWVVVGCVHVYTCPYNTMHVV
jgi:hypothetical protein